MTAAQIEQPTPAAPEPTPAPAELPVLVGLAEMCALFPVAEQTVYRWRTRHNLPEPRITVSGTPMWELPVIEAFAKERGHKLDRAELRRIRKAQGH